MTDVIDNPAIRRARALTSLAAQWLQLLSFAAHTGAPVFSPDVCHYQSMLDPDASDAARLSACRAMEISVRRRLPAEEMVAEAKRARERPVDPYDLHWRITRQGAALWMIAHLLSAAIRRFENEDVGT